MCVYEGDSGGTVLNYYTIAGVIDSGYICFPPNSYEDIAYYTEAKHVESVYGVEYE